MYSGHHAGYQSYGGYCYLNNACICVAQLIKRYDIKCVILDLNHHAGDGTVNIQYLNSPFKEVITVSIHADPSLDYPYYNGYAISDLNSNRTFLIYKQNTTVDDYLKLLQQAIIFIKGNTTIDVLVIPFGADTYKDVPDASHQVRTKLELDDYKLIANNIRTAFPDIPIIVTQEGGYLIDTVDTIVVNFLQGLSLD